MRGIWLGLALLTVLVLAAASTSHAAILDAQWTAPTVNTDGSALTDLGSYRVYFGVSSAPCPGSSFVSVTSPTASPQPGDTVSVRLGALTSGTLYFVAVSAIDLNGNESSCSAAASAVAQMTFGVTPPTAVNFGNINVGSVAEQTFTVTNSRGGTVTGGVSVTAPFSIVSGSPFNLVGSGTTATVTVRFSPTTAGVTTTNLNFTADGDTISRIVTGTAVGSATPAITSLTPASVAAGSADFTLRATGTGFAAGATATVKGVARSATFVSGTRLDIAVQAGDVAAVGSVPIQITNPTPCPATGCVSNSMALAVTPAPVVTALSASPTTGPPGSALTVTLTNWAGGSLDWLAIAPTGAANTTYVLPYVYVSTLPGTGGTRTWTTTMPATLGTYEARLFPNNGYTRAATSNSITVANVSPTPAITAITPASVAAGSAGFTLRVTGTGFVTGATVTVGGTSRGVSSASDTHLDIGVQAGDVATVGSAPIQVTNPTPCVPVGGCVSNSTPLAVTTPPAAPILSSVTPTTAAAGGSGFTLTATGQNFMPSSVVQVNGSARATTFGTSTSLTATIQAGDIASAGTLAVTVATPAPCVGAVAGFCVSAAQSVTVIGPALSASPTTGPPGSTLTVTLTNWSSAGADWLALAPTGAGNTSYLPSYVYVSSLPGAGGTRTWTTTMPTTLGTYEARLFLNNGYTRAATSNSITVANINPTPAITALSPSSVVAGGGSFTLRVTGTGFVTGATATVGGAARALSFVSGTQLDVSVQAGDVAGVGSVPVQVTNPTSCVSTGCVSNSMTLAVTTPPAAPILDTITPTTAAAGGSSFTLTATGQNFMPSSIVQVNGTARATTFGTSTSLTAAILAGDVASTGNLVITVATPAPCVGAVAGVCLSAAQTLTVLGPSLTVSSTSVAGGQQVTVTLANGYGNALDWIALAQTGSPNTSYLQWTYVGAGVTSRTWTVTTPTTPGQYEFRLFLNNGYVLQAASPAVAVTTPGP